MSFLDKPTLSADNGSFFQKNLVYQTEKPTLSKINLLYLIIMTTACHMRAQIIWAFPTSFSCSDTEKKTDGAQMRLEKPILFARADKGSLSERNPHYLRVQIIWVSLR